MFLFIQNKNTYLIAANRIDTHFADIHGFMNVGLVGAIQWTALDRANITWVSSAQFNEPR